jgi:hypothetical protein
LEQRETAKEIQMSTTETTASFGIIVFGSWFTGLFRGGEVGSSDWVRDAKTFDTEEDADRFAAFELGHIQANAVKVVPIGLR